MRKFFVSYLANKEPKNDSIVLYEKECESAKEGKLAWMIWEEIRKKEKSDLFYNKDIVLINFWEIYDET